jgi:hypothetical protein
MALMLLGAPAGAQEIARDRQPMFGTAPVATPRLQITDEIIRKAVRDTLAEEPNARPNGSAFRAQPNRYATFAAIVDDATVPDCLHSDGLKHQPTGIGPLQINGLLAIPFVAVAKLRGKCQ